MTSTPLSAAETFAPGLFTGRTVLVTGGGRGIGRATALGFAQLGADVALAARDADNLAKTHADIEALGVRCISQVCDIRNTESVESLRNTVMSSFTKLDFLINNAGGQFPARPSEISDRGFRAVVDLNLHGTWNMLSPRPPSAPRECHS